MLQGEMVENGLGGTWRKFVGWLLSVGRCRLAAMLQGEMVEFGGWAVDMVKIGSGGSESAEAPSGPRGPGGEGNEGTELRDIMLPLQRT